MDICPFLCSVFGGFSVGSLVPQVDPYDSLASLMPQADGFQSLGSFLGGSPSPPSRQVPNPTNLESIAENEDTGGVASESPAGNLEAEAARVPTASGVQPDTTTLDPFPSDGRNFLSESPDIDENGPVALAAIDNFDDVSSTAGPGFGTSPSAPDPFHDPPEFIYQAGDRPPPYFADDSASPLFSGRLVNPPVPGAKVTQPISSSTPLGRSETNQMTLRQRDVHGNSDP